MTAERICEGEASAEPLGGKLLIETGSAPMAVSMKSFHRSGGHWRDQGISRACGEIGCAIMRALDGWNSHDSGGTACLKN